MVMDLILSLASPSIKLLLAKHMAAALPVGTLDLALNLMAQVPELAIVQPMHVVRQLVAQRLADGLVVAVAVVGVGAQAELDDFAAVAVQA